MYERKELIGKWRHTVCGHEIEIWLEGDQKLWYQARLVAGCEVCGRAAYPVIQKYVDDQHAKYGRRH
jgi:hypothetical protein